MIKGRLNKVKDKKMSDYEHGQSASDGDDVERVLEEKKQAVKGRRGPKPGTKRAPRDEDEVIRNLTRSYSRLETL